MKKQIRGLFFAAKMLLNPKSAQGQTYFPEKQRKGKARVFFEQLMHALKYGENYRYYYVYGMDMVGKKDSEYMDYYSFIKLRNRLNMKGTYNYVCLLRDKKYFGIIASAYGLRTATNVAMIHNGVPTESVEKLLLKNNHLFCKPVDSMCGDGVFELLFHENEYYIDTKKCSSDSLSHYIKTLKGDFIVQPFVEQHKEISAINDKCINTVRIVTVNPHKSVNPDDVVILGALLRIGINDMHVDNWAKGGLVVGINDDGTMMKYGFYKPGHGTKTERHPNSGVVFEGRKIPMYDELTKQVKFFHSKLNGIYTIGWDIAITNDGPLFIEGNDDYELGFLQTCFGGMRSYFNEYFK